ncbi:MAG: hypothetical protein II682_05850, partial [Firmicutes bacterium]|nr:hypothetical protein [Bacillota bacterium]
MQVRYWKRYEKGDSKVTDKTIITILITALIAFIVSAVVTRILIPYLRKWAGQNIREDGPQAHLSKQGTPSMGGIAIVLAIVVGGLFGAGGLVAPERLRVRAVRVHRPKGLNAPEGFVCI